MAAVKKKKGLMYKGKPLLRCGNRIYYGNLEDKLILALDIVESSKKQNDGLIKFKLLHFYVTAYLHL